MNPAPESILAFRNGSIGNTLVAVPALRALRRRYPQARLTVVVDPVGDELLAHCPWIDARIVYDRRGRDRGLAAWLRLVGRLRAVHPTHAVLFKRFFRNGLLARLSGARVRAGFATNGRAPFLNLTIPYEEGANITRLNLCLAARLGASPEDAAPEFWLSAEDRAAADRWLAAHDLAGRRIVVAHYGGLSTPPTFLGPGAFATLVRAAAGPDRRVALLGAGAAEAAWAAEVAGACPGARHAAGLSLRGAAALMARAELFLGFNSGPAHLAAAVGTSAHILFKPGPGAEREVAKWLPATPAAHALVPPDDAGPDATLAWCAAVGASIATAPIASRSA